MYDTPASDPGSTASNDQSQCTTGGRPRTLSEDPTVSRITPPPSLPRSSTRRPPSARRAPAPSWAAGAALAAAGVFSTHAPAATAGGQARPKARLKPRPRKPKQNRGSPTSRCAGTPARASTTVAPPEPGGPAEPSRPTNASPRSSKTPGGTTRSSPSAPTSPTPSGARWISSCATTSPAGAKRSTPARDAQKAFYRALEAGDPEAAAGHIDAVDRAQATIVRSQLELRLAVARLLAPDQRTALTKTRPRLWRERWIRLEPRANTTRRGLGGATTEDGSGS